MISLERTRFPCIVWATAALALWAGMPSAACVCADGRLKLFCVSQATESPQPTYSRSCCDAIRESGAPQTARRDARPRSCCATGGASTGVSAGAKSTSHRCGGCVSVERTLATCPTAAIQSVAFEVGLSHSTPVEFQLHSPQSHTAALNPFRDTGPPTDLPIVLERLLI